MLNLVVYEIDHSPPLPSGGYSKFYGLPPQGSLPLYLIGNWEAKVQKVFKISPNILVSSCPVKLHNAEPHFDFSATSWQNF